MFKIEKISSAMFAAGFDACGVVRAESMTQEQTEFEKWLSEGCADGMGYLWRNIPKRFAPQLLFEGARSVIIGAVGYKNDSSMGYPDDCNAKIASFALSRDYHLSVREMLVEVAAELGLTDAGEYKICTDAAPLSEKSLARRAGLGWKGRNSLIVNPVLGSFMVFGELIVREECDAYSEPLDFDGCAGCARCVLRCPTEAIRPDRTIDTRKCISNRTIESRTQEEFDAHGWLFGCDECQSACPYNSAAPMFRNERFVPLFDPADKDLGYWKALSDEELAERYGSTALVRAFSRKPKRHG